MRDIFKTAVILSIISFSIKLLGPIKNIVIANQFGISRRLDAYFISQNFVDVITAVFTFSIIIIVIPAFVEELSESKKRGRNFSSSINSFLSQSFLVSFVLAAVFFCFSSPISRTIPGFSDSNARNDLSNLLAMLSLALLFSIPISTLTGYFHSVKRLVLPSLLNLFPVVSTILFIILFSRSIDIFSIPAGIIFGNFIIFIFLLVKYLRSVDGVHFKVKDIRILRKVKNLIIPTMIFSAGGHINLLVDLIITSRIKDGAVSILSYAQFFIMMPFALITIPLITALFPEMSKRSLFKESRSLIDLTSKGFVALAAIIVPVIVIILFFRVSMIDLFYNHGKFDSQAIGETAQVLLAYGPAVLFISLNNLLQRIFFSKRKMFILMSLTIISLSVNIILDLYFSSLLSVTGIALSTSANELLYFFIIFTILHKRFDFSFIPRIKRELMQILISAAIMGGTLFITLAVFPLSPGAPKSDLFLSLLLHLSFGFAAYLLSMQVIFKGDIFKHILKKNE